MFYWIGQNGMVFKANNKTCGGHLILGILVMLRSVLALYNITAV